MITAAHRPAHSCGPVVALRASLALLFTLAVGSGSLRAQTAPRATTTMPSVTLDEAVALALRASPDIVRGIGATRVAHALERSAAGAYLPTLGFETNAIRATTPSPVSQPGALGGAADRTAAAGLTSSLDLFTAGRRGAERKRASAESEASDADLIARRFGVALDAQHAVFTVLRNGELVRVTRAQVARAQEGVSVAQRRHDAGVATRSDDLRARLELTQARSRLAQVEGDLRASRWALARVVGSDQAVDAAPVDSLAPRPLPLADSALVALIASASPSVRTAEADQRSAAAEVRSVRSRFAPALQLTGGYRMLSQPIDPPIGNRPIWSLRLGLSYPLFDGFQRDEALERARVTSESADADVRDRRRVLRAEGERALEALRVAEQRIALGEEGVAAATEDLRVVRARYQAGMATILELVTSQSNLAQSENDLVNARFDYAVSRAELTALAGRPL